jgi:two-component system chemotaxis response regulator CheB
VSNTKILVVDDSAVMRRLLSDAINNENNMEVSGTARDGEDAIRAIEIDVPHIVLLDLEMPVLDGLGALHIIADRWPDLPVVVFSSFTAEGSAASIQALTLGASECLLKPKTTSAEKALSDISARLIPVVNALIRTSDRREAKMAPPTIRLAERSSADFEALVIASSTGGPVALEQVLTDLGEPPVPTFLVQHMPPMFTAQLACRLADQTGLDVAEAVEGETVTSGMIRMAPGGLHMEIHRPGAEAEIRLTATPPIHHVRPAADPMFASAARAFQGNLLGLILTGMGTDGVGGARAIVEAGGEVLVQDEATSVVWGMPGAVASAGYATSMLPLARIGGAVRHRLKSEPRREPLQGRPSARTGRS